MISRSIPAAALAEKKAQKDTTPPVKRVWWVWLPILLFVGLSLGVLPYPGVQNDEALFSNPLYSEVTHDMKMRAFHHDIPLMLLSYLGTAKTWLYGIIFHFWNPGLFSLRVPVILLGALTLWVLFEWVSRLAGRVAAFATCLLLGTDTSFVLTNTFDWGPVAIQHLTLLAGLLFLLKGYRRNHPAGIGVGFLLLGIGMWDKAIFIWVLSGATLAALILFPAAMRTAFTRRNIAAAVIGFCVGACPLIIYNIRNPLQTFRGNAVFDPSEVRLKLRIAQGTLAGSNLFGYLAAEEWTKKPKPPTNAVERASVQLREWVGEHRSSLLLYAFAVALLAVPLWWPRRKLVFFALIVILVAWLQMAFVKDTGGGAHHVVLLWPFPHLIVGLALAGATQQPWRFAKWLGGAALAVICVSSLLVYNQYLCQFIRNGATTYWTDAIMPLSTKLAQWEDRPLLLGDWGMDYGVRMLNQGRFKKLWNANDIVSHELNADDRAMLGRMFLLPGAYFITHTPEFEIQAGSRQRLLSTASSFGYQPRIVAAIDDSNHRTAFEIIEFVKATGQ